ncbi:MAG: hypothetical protein ACREB5_05975 [Sphingomonadaceae bacterium]
MTIDHAGQDEQAGGIQAQGTGARGRIEGSDEGSIRDKIGTGERGGQDCPAGDVK